MGAKAFSYTHRTKVFADGTVRKIKGVTPGELPGSSGGTEGSGSISASETRSSALEVVGRLGSTGGAAKVAPPEHGDRVGRGSQPAKTVEERQKAR